MRTPESIYASYPVMAGLRMHQLRVGGVCKMICNALTCDVDERSVVLAGLFHDIGNLIKSDLTVFPEFAEPEGVAHWELEKRKMRKKYGENELEATIQIARELSLPESSIALIRGSGFRKLETLAKNASMEMRIFQYADMRVGPHGVLSLLARIEEAKKRYVGKHPDMPDDADFLARLIRAAQEIEQQIFALAAIGPDDITEQSIQPAIQELRQYEVS